MPPEHHETQPSAEIAHVEGTKCRRECVLTRSGATLCGDRACRGREMQARVRFGPVRRNPLRRSRASRTRNAGDSASWIWRAQPSAEIVRVEGAKCRRECVLSLSGATLCGDRARRRREMQGRYLKWPVCTNVVHQRRVATRSAQTLAANMSLDTRNHPAHQRHGAFTPACFALPSGTAPRKHTSHPGRAKPHGAATSRT